MKIAFEGAAVTAVALVVMLVVRAPAAPAAEFGAEAFPVAYVGETDEPFAFGGLVTCTDVPIEGATELEASSETVVFDLPPAFSTCDFGETGGELTLAGGGCQLVFHAHQEVAPEEFDGAMDLSCPQASLGIHARS